jgi:REP element-mobilizing transposase RayT
MAEELNRFGIDVLAWCLMTNHTHLLVVPKDLTVLARAIGEAWAQSYSSDVRRWICFGKDGLYY